MRWLLNRNLKSHKEDNMPNIFKQGLNFKEDLEMIIKEDVQKAVESLMRFLYSNFISDRYPSKLASIFLYRHPL